MYRIRRSSLARALLVSIILLASVSSAALADGMILPEAMSPDYLTVRSHHVTVRIEDNHAVTSVSQEFYNPHPVTVRGRYIFPLPPDAIISNFRAEVDGLSPTIIRQDRRTTNAALHAAILERRDPTLLQYADWETLAFDVSLAPYSSKKMTLEYEEVLLPEGGLTRYRYVLSTERYTSAALEEVSITIDLTSSQGLSTLYSSTHPVTTELRGEGRARLHWSDEYVIPGEDFELFFAPAEGGFGAGLLTGERADRDHFLFLFSPEAAAMEARSMPKDIVFVFDRSGSMEGDKIAQAQKGFRYMVDRLNEDDRFSIITFNDTMDVFSRKLQPVSSRSLREARDFVDWTIADGWTDLEGALQTGLTILGRSESRGATRMVVFLTDGLPTAGVTDEAIIPKLVRRANDELKARLHVFGLGYDVNTHLLDRLAADNGGTVTYVQPGENLETALSDFYSRMAHPILTDVSVDFDGMRVTDVYPQSMPDLFDGSTLMLTGRYRASRSRVTVRVSGWDGMDWQETEYKFDLDESGGRDFVPRLWATRRIGELLDEVRVYGETAARVEEIRELGIAYGVVTPYTTFVIQSHTEGVASDENMGLYSMDGLNEAVGDVTVRARVQNQAYQQAAQADMAVGANVLNRGKWSTSNLDVDAGVSQSLDLSLLLDVDAPQGPVSMRWIEDNIQIDQTIEFGSDEYFELAHDADARDFLQAGTNVMFNLKGQVISVVDSEGRSVSAKSITISPAPQTQNSMPYNQTSNLLESLLELLSSLVR